MGVVKSEAAGSATIKEVETATREQRDCRRAKLIPVAAVLRAFPKSKVLAVRFPSGGGADGLSRLLRCEAALDDPDENDGADGPDFDNDDPGAGGWTTISTDVERYRMKDIMGMMGKVKEMQSKMEACRPSLRNWKPRDSREVGMVTVTLTGKGAMKGVKIDPSLLKKDEGEILEDLIVAAHNQAKEHAEAGGAGKDGGTDGRITDPAGDEAAVLGAR